MVLIVRPFEEDDRKTVISLWERCGLIVPWNNPGMDIDRKLKVRRDLFVVGEAGSVLVATAMGGYDGHRGWINYLAVDPRFRRRGFGRALMEHLEKKLLESGCPKINIQVRRKNLEVIGFYTRLGYEDDDLVSLGKRLREDPPFGGAG